MVELIIGTIGALAGLAGAIKTSFDLYRQVRSDVPFERQEIFLDALGKKKDLDNKARERNRQEIESLYRKLTASEPLAKQLLRRLAVRYIIIASSASVLFGFGLFNSWKLGAKFFTKLSFFGVTVVVIALLGLIFLLLTSFPLRRGGIGLRKRILSFKEISNLRGMISPSLKRIEQHRQIIARRLRWLGLGALSPSELHFLESYILLNSMVRWLEAHFLTKTVEASVSKVSEIFGNVYLEQITLMIIRLDEANKLKTMPMQNENDWAKEQKKTLEEAFMESFQMQGHLIVDENFYTQDFKKTLCSKSREDLKELVKSHLIKTGEQPVPSIKVTAIQPYTGSKTTSDPIKVSITGTGFAGGAKVKLTPPSASRADIDGEVVDCTASEIKCAFNLQGRSPGNWHVVVINPDGMTDILHYGFKVTP